MNEDYLHYLWKYRLFKATGIKTTGGEEIVVQQTGTYNTDAGPDFFNARIQIGKTTWAGNVEIHVNASDWNKHRHQFDEAYNNVILHVVLNADEEVKNTFGKTIPCVELNGRISLEHYHRYEKLIHTQRTVPCARQFPGVEEIIRYNQIDRMLVNRLERKVEPVKELLRQYDNDWEKCTYILLARNFGFKVNALPFEALARNTPLAVLKKSVGNLKRMEALLFGQAGLLNEELKDDYYQFLRNEYRILQSKYSLRPLRGLHWKFSRMRPVNFPSIRIAQFAALLQEHHSLFGFLQSAIAPDVLVNRFRISASPYWDHHYTFSVPSPVQVKSMGEHSLHNILINSVAPVLFAYGQLQSDDSFCERSRQLLERLPAEDNRIVRYWSGLGLKARSVADSQGLLELFNELCSRKKCLNCSIGTKILLAQ